MCESLLVFAIHLRRRTTRDLHFSKQGGLHPNGNTVEGSQTLLDQMSFIDGDTGFGRSLLARVPVPSSPLHDTNSCHSQMCLHTQQDLIVPIGSPLTCITSMQDNWKKGRHNHQTICGIQVHSLDCRWILGSVVPGRRGCKANCLLSSCRSGRTNC